MIVFRRRLLYWLIKAYIKKWGKLILLYFAIGLFVFFAFNLVFSTIAAKIHFAKKETIGIVGAYRIEDLPSTILYKISRGLTSVKKDGIVKPDVASYWKIENNRKTYVFYLRRDIYFSDGTNLTSDHVRYNFADVSIKRPAKYTIVYSLKDSYSPFAITVAKPIFKNGLIGVSDHKIKDIKLNGSFVEYIDLVSKNGNRVIYQFYPTTHALKIAFSLGEVTKIAELPDVNFRDTTFYFFKNAKVDKKPNYKRLTTLFYNTKDELLSSKTLREALSYTIPDNFDEGLRSFGPFPPFSFVSQKGVDIRRQDLQHAKLLLDKAINENGTGKKISLTIDTLPKFKNVADKIVDIWKRLDIDVDIKTDDKVPEKFQIFLGEFNLPQDVDQYTLWHSNQPSNITHYANLRVDKLLEDGRKEVDVEKRKKIYADFQKFIQSDPPASFLFFPHTYDVTRK